MHNMHGVKRRNAALPDSTVGTWHYGAGLELFILERGNTRAVVLFFEVSSGEIE